MKYFAIVAAVLGLIEAPPAQSAERIGIFENIFETSVSFSETTAAIESSLADSTLTLHGSYVRG